MIDVGEGPIDLRCGWDKAPLDRLMQEVLHGIKETLQWEQGGARGELVRGCVGRRIQKNLESVAACQGSHPEVDLDVWELSIEATNTLLNALFKEPVFEWVAWRISSGAKDADKIVYYISSVLPNCIIKRVWSSRVFDMDVCSVLNQEFNSVKFTLRRREMQSTSCIIILPVKANAII